MMKKIKVMLTIILMIGMIVIPLGTVKAHTIDLDPKSLISFPMMISNGKGKITIKSSETNYNLYYQAVEISNETYKQIEETTNKGKTERDTIKKAMETLDKECEELETIYDEANEAYQEKLDNNITGSELETAKTAYETAKTNYQNKVNEYKSKVKEYNDKTDEINAKIKELTPSYIENNWIKTEDGNFTIDLSLFSGSKTFAVWVKLISSDGTISYDEGTYTTSGTKTDEVKGEDTNQGNDDKTEDKKDNVIKPTIKNETPKDNTLSSKKLPQTGASMAIVISILVMLLIVVVSYKKCNNYKDIK